MLRLVAGLGISTRGAHAAGSAALPSLEVRATRVGAYGAQEVTSSPRISPPIQAMTVLTRELIDDTHGLRMTDVARFATQIVEAGGQPPT